MKDKRITIERYGIASSLFFDCLNCTNQTGCRADLVSGLEEEWSEKPAGKKFNTHSRIE
jgi:hypothetical protein